MKNIRFKSYFLLGWATVLLSSCTALRTAPFDQYSYQKAVEIKVDASRLMDKATMPYADHAEEVERLLVDMEKIQVYEAHKPNNGISYKMWQLLSDEENNLLAGFFKKWREEGQLSPTFLEAAKGQVIEAMDLLIQYEGKKDAQAESGLRELLLGS